MEVRFGVICYLEETIMKTLEEIIIQILEDTIGYNIVKLLEKLFFNIIGGNFSVKLLKAILIYNFYTTILEDKLC